MIEQWVRWDCGCIGIRTPIGDFVLFSTKSEPDLEFQDHSDNKIDTVLDRTEVESTLEDFNVLIADGRRFR